MGIDHGLGGRENEKCKEKRKKKAARRKTEILRTICDNSNELKKEVVFNESARADWLTGFNKRKQMRRQYGVAMQVCYLFVMDYLFVCTSKHALC